MKFPTLPLLSALLLGTGLLTGTSVRGTAADFIVTTDIDGGPGSLRQAILDANANSGPDVVRFALSGSLLNPTLGLKTALPVITEALVMDGTIHDTNTVILRFTPAQGETIPPDASILSITGGGSTIRKFRFLGFGTEGAVKLAGKGGNTLDNLSVGVPLDENISGSNFFSGLNGLVVASDDNTILNCWIANVSEEGIRLTGNRNSVKGCRFGLKTAILPSEVKETPNGTAIRLIGGSDNIIGGQPGSRDSNQICSSKLGGIQVEGGTGHRILGNDINFWRNLRFPNGAGTAGFGIQVGGGASDILIEGTSMEATNGRNIIIAECGPKVRIAGVRMTGGSSDGIFVGNGVSGLTIEDTSIARAAGAGIRLEGGGTAAGPVLIRQNAIGDCAVGIDVVSGMGLVTIGTRRDETIALSNTLYRNQNGGIIVRDPAAVVRISENAIFGKADSISLPIDLKPSGEAANTVTPNDPLDADSGPNQLQNSPVLTTVTPLSGRQLKIEGKLSAKPSVSYVIEAQQGGTWLASGTVTTSSTGEADISLSATGYEADSAITLTATSPDGQTSEYGNAVMPPPAALQFPSLNSQSSLSLPENGPSSGSVFSIPRGSGVTGAFKAVLKITPGFSLYGSNGGAPVLLERIPGIPLRYRFSSTQAWIDLEWNTPVDIPFTADQSQRIIYLSAKDDSSWDPAQKPSALTLNRPGAGETSISILFPDNDPPPVVSLEHMPIIWVLTPGRVMGEYPSPYDRFMLKLDRASTVALDFRVSVNAQRTVAVAGQDYKWHSGEPSFASVMAGEWSSGAAIFLEGIEDTLVEGTEIIALDITSTTPAFSYTTEDSIFLLDNDFNEASVADAQVTEGNTGTVTLNFPVTLANAASGDLILNWAVNGGTATAGSDFTGVSGAVTLPAGAVSASIPVIVNGDREMEPDETLNIILFTPGNDSVRFTNANATGRILNDDVPAVSIADVTVSEETGQVTVRATLSQAVPFTLPVSFSIQNGTAVNGADFTGPFDSTFNFPAGSTEASAVFSIYNDSAAEPDETFSVVLESSSAYTVTDGTAVVTITDSDLPLIWITSALTVTEGDEGTQTVTVSIPLREPAIRQASVDWRVAAGSTAAAPASGTVVYAPGANAASITLAVPGNRIPQPERTVELEFSNAVNLSYTGSQRTVLRVLDNDRVTVSGAGFSKNEGDSGVTAASFRISIPSALEVPVSVHYETADGTARAGSDYAAASGTATIPAGATEALIPVSITADAIYEENESFSLILSSPVNATLDPAPLIGSILNDDAQPSLSVSSAVVTASAGGSFQAWIEVKLGDGGSGVELPVSYKVTTRDDTALADVHYTPIRGKKLTFQPGRGTEWIAVTVAGMVSEHTVRRFYVDFTPVAGPVSTVTADVSIEPLRVTDFSRLTPGLFFIQFPTGKGQNYVVQEAPSLTGPWVDNSSILLGSGSPVTQAVASAKSRAYFRVRSYSNPPSTAATLTP